MSVDNRAVSERKLLEIILCLGGRVFFTVKIEFLGQKTDEIVLELTGTQAGEILEFQPSLVSF